MELPTDFLKKRSCIILVPIFFTFRFLMLISLTSAMKATAQNQNVRRENKLYSYADQMAELELRKVRTFCSTDIINKLLYLYSL